MHRVLPLLLPLLLGLAGCERDPIDKPGTWSLAPSGLNSNDENLRTMLVNPNDLVAGSGSNTSTGNAAAQPVERLNTGRRYPLPASVGSVIAAPTQQQQGGPGGGGGAGPQ